MSTIKVRRCASALTVALLLVGGADSVVAGERQVVNYWSRKAGPDHVVIQEAVEAFNRQQTVVEVKFQVMPWGGAYNSRIRTALLAGKPPEVFDIAPWAAPYFLPYVQTFAASDLAALGVRKEDFVPQAAEGVRFGDRYVGVPMSVLPLALYYNRELFQQAGLNPDQPPRDLKEFIDYAKRLTRDTDGDGKPDQWGWMLGASLNPNTWVWESMLVANGGSLLSDDRTKAAFNSPAGRAALQTLLDLARVHKAAPAELGDPAKAFVAGKVAMTIDGIWMIPGFKGKVPFASAAVPQLGGSRPAVWGSLDVYVLPKHTPGALTFAGWMAGPEGQRYYARAHLPARLEVLRSPAVMGDPHFAPLAKSMDRIFVPAPHKNLMEVYDRVWKAIQAAYTGGVAPEKALEQASTEASEILRRK